MNRLTTDFPGGNLQNALNMFYARNGEAWIRTGDYLDKTLNAYIRTVVGKYATDTGALEDANDMVVAEIMADWLTDGTDSIEGLIGTLYTAAWAFAELRARLKAYEDTGLMPDDVSELMRNHRIALRQICDLKEVHTYAQTDR